MIFRKLTLILSFGYALAIRGGWRTIENLDDENVVAAAEYALYNLEDSTQSYSFEDTVLQSNCILTPKVLDGRQQVVAGMNYDLEIEVLDCDNSCVGVFQTTVYVGFSPDDMEVTNWGSELPCPQPSSWIAGGWSNWCPVCDRPASVRRRESRRMPRSLSRIGITANLLSTRHASPRAQ